MSWEEISIGDLGQVITGNTPPKNNPEFYGNDYRFIKPTDMEIGQRYTPITEDYYSEVAYKKYINSLIPPLSTCVVTIGSIGKKMTLTDDYSFVNQAVNAVIPDIKKYDSFFVFYALKNILHKVKSADTGATSGRENVSKSNFMGLKLEVPENIEMQNKIGQILSSFDDLIENNLKRIRLLEETAQNIYKEWFVNFRFPNYDHTEFDVISGLPVGWEIVPFSQCADFINGFAFKPHHHNENGFPIIKIKELKNGLNSETPRYLGDDVPQKYFFGDETILFSWSADINVYWWANGESVLNQHLFKVVPFDNVIKEHFYFGLKNSVPDFLSRANGSTMKHIKRVELDNVNYTKPVNSVAIKFQEQIKPILKQLVLINNQNQKLKEARDILLPRLMNRTIEI